MIGYEAGVQFVQRLKLRAVLNIRTEHARRFGCGRTNAHRDGDLLAQAAVRIGIGESAVRERIRRGLLAGRKWEGRWYVASADIDSAIERGTPSATVPVHSGRDMAPAALTRPEAVAINRR